MSGTEPLRVQFDAPNQAWYEDAIETLRWKGYREWLQAPAKRLKVGTFVVRPSIMRVYWVEPSQFGNAWSYRLIHIRETKASHSKKRRM